ncbi:PTS sugar transporter subunit IIA, partial [Listeria monocytogenes]|nr:PTS sugar transporter subunit IIA [Listeria monocytogenes]
RLEKVLADYLMPVPEENTTKHEGKSTLADLLEVTLITRKKSVKDWHEAIYHASLPFLSAGVVEPAYVEEMKRQYPAPIMNIILRNTI